MNRKIDILSIPEQISSFVKLTNFRYVRESDAKFILELRSNEKKNRYISSTSASLEEQKKWIQAYMEREKLGDEFYFVMNDGQSDVGLVRIYGVREDCFCWGSWIIKEGVSGAHALESVLAIYQLGFDQLGFDYSYFDVRKENVKVVKFHVSTGAVEVREDNINYYFHFYPEGYEKMKKKYKKFIR